MTSRSGFSAECHDCPTMIGEEYGQTIYTGVVSINDSAQAQAEIVEWARIHALIHDHAVRVSKYISWDFEVKHMDPEIWTKVTGG